MYCRSCGKEIGDTVSFCPYCGQRIVDVAQDAGGSTPPRAYKNQTVNLAAADRMKASREAEGRSGVNEKSGNRQER